MVYYYQRKAYKEFHIGKKSGLAESLVENLFSSFSR